MAVTEALSSLAKGATYRSPTTVERVVTSGIMLAGGVVLPRVIDRTGARLVGVAQNGLEHIVDLPDDDKPASSPPA